MRRGIAKPRDGVETDREGSGGRQVALATINEESIRASVPRKTLSVFSRVFWEGGGIFWGAPSIATKVQILAGTRRKHTATKPATAETAARG